jgi:hypothetical protein
MRIIENLLIMQARQLQRRNDDMKKTRVLLKRMRKKKKNFDSEHFVVDENINKNDLVFLHDIQYENDQSINRKLKYK